MAGDVRATFAIDLEDGTSGSAEAAAKALEQLRGSIDGGKKELRAMQAAMKSLQGGTSVNIEAFRKLKSRIDAQKQSVAEAQTKFVELGGSFDVVKRKSPVSFFDKLKEAAGGVPGPLGKTIGRLGNLKGIMAAGAIAAGIFLIAKAMVAVASAAVNAASSLLKYGVAQADARRSELLRLDGLTRLRNVFGAAAGSASEVQGAIDRVSAGSALGRSQIAGYAEQLYRMGLRGGNLSEALDGMAIRSVALGERFGRSFAGMAAATARAGGSVHALTESVRTRLGGLASKHMLSLSVQSAKLKESVTAIFSGLKIEGFLTALRSITELFSQNTASGRALKEIAEGIFQPMLDVAAELGPVMRRFFQGVIIGALKLDILFQNLRIVFKAALGGRYLFDSANSMSSALKLGEMALFGIAGVAAVAAAAVVALAAPFIAAAAWGYFLAKTIDEAVTSILQTTSKWYDAGRNLVRGFVNGIKSAVSSVGDTVRNLATRARDALIGALGIRSPSRVFAELGIQIPRGLEQGIGRGEASVGETVGRLVEEPDAPVSAGGNRSVSIAIGDIHISGGGSDPASHARAFVDELSRALEGVGIQMGAAT
jgi:hypothetical protein